MTHRDPITSLRNRRIVEARKLNQRKYRRRQGRFLVEGLQLLHMALEAGKQPLEVFYCESLFAGSGAPALIARAQKTEAALIPVSAEVMRALSKREGMQGIVATFARFNTPLNQLDLPEQALVIVLDRLRGLGNVGTLIRTADAAGAAAVILLEPCSDVFAPKAVRASMGSIFNLPIVHTPDSGALFAWLAAQDIRPVAADAHQGIHWGKGLWQDSMALVLGNEAQGLSPDVRDKVDAWINLPMHGKADSLNVAVAGGILMYAWLKEKEKEP